MKTLDSLLTLGPPQYCTNTLLISSLGLQDYQTTLQAMQYYTKNRQPTAPDQIWLLEHHPIYTSGPLSQKNDILATLPYPLISTDRGGKITFHAPGQLIGYCMFQLKNLQESSNLVTQIERLLITLLSTYHITAHANTQYRGVYVQQEKIASIGLRVKKNFTYHGFALNVDMDLLPFKKINPCGRSQKMTQITHYQKTTMEEVFTLCIQHIKNLWRTTHKIVCNPST